jgi:hypothetical protein
VTAAEADVEVTASQVDVQGIDAASCRNTSVTPQPCNEGHSDDSDFEPPGQRLGGHQARGEEAIASIAKLLLGFYYH